MVSGLTFVLAALLSPAGAEANARAPYSPSHPDASRFWGSCDEPSDEPSGENDDEIAPPAIAALAPRAPLPFPSSRVVERPGLRPPSPPLRRSDRPPRA